MKILVSVDIINISTSGHGSMPVYISGNQIKFKFDYYLNEIEFMNLEFTAKFNGYDEKQIAEQIAGSMYQTHKGFWASAVNFKPDDGFTIEIIYSAEAKEIFDIISKYKPELLSSTIPHL